MPDDVLLLKASKSDVEEFNRKCRAYWKRNISKYFDRTHTVYGLPTKLNHRFVITPGDEGGGSRIKDAIIVSWSPMMNTIHIKHGKILVQSQSGYETVKVPKKGGRGRPGTVKLRAHDLFRILQEGTPATPGAFVIGKNPRTGTRYGFRIPAGIRGPQSNKAWNAWMREFVMYVDAQLEVLADKLADQVVKRLMKGKESSLGLTEIYTPNDINSVLIGGLLRGMEDEFG